MAGRPYILAETNWKDVRETEYDVAILPWGATEAHNYHLPYSTDVVQCDEIAAEAAKRAWGQGARPIVLPTVPFGVNTGQLDVKLDINMNPSTQLAVLSDVVAALERQGIDRLLIMNGHGGNDFRQMVRELLGLNGPRGISLPSSASFSSKTTSTATTPVRVKICGIRDAPSALVAAASARAEPHGAARRHRHGTIHAAAARPRPPQQ